MRTLRTLRKLRTLATAALLAATAHGAQAQQNYSISFPLTDYTTWNLFGAATAQTFEPGNGFIYSNLYLTSPNGDSAGAGFTPNAIGLDFNQAFRFSFNFFIPVSTNTMGDGLTFTLTTTPGVGNGGSGLGYEGQASSSVAFAIDTFYFEGEPVSPSIQWLARGSVTPLAATETGLGETIRDPNFQWSVVLEYTPSGLGDDAGTLLGTLDHLNLGIYTVSTAIDFGSTGLDMAGQALFFGFTAGNGLAQDQHIVTSAMPVPEPGAWAMLLVGLLATGTLARRRMGVAAPL